MRMRRRTFSASRLVACCLTGFGLIHVAGASAQGVAPFAVEALPSFAWPQATEINERTWAGSFARMWTGFEASSSRRLGSYAGPTVGFEGGRMWQDGRIVYGIVGRFDYLAALGGSTPSFGGIAYSRDFAGAAGAKVGVLVTPDVLVYAKVGAAAVHETWRFGASPYGLPFERDDVAIRPEARAGVEWAVTDRLSVAVEAGASGRGPRW